MKRFVSVFLAAVLVAVSVLSLAACDGKERVVIYTSAEDYRVERLTEMLNAAFPEYEIVIEYMSTGNHAAKLMAEGSATECDITYDLEYGYLAQLDARGLFADLSGYDMSIYAEDTVVSNNYIVVYRNGGAIIVNRNILTQKGLPAPTSYDDLLDPQYKGLISMPSPKSSGTGYMFLLNLVNVMGEDSAFAYFDALTQNILQYTSSGSGPVNALIQGEAAIGLGMTGQAVMQINNGADYLDVLYFEEGSPFTLYGQAVISGKETREAVKRVFDFLIKTFNYENNEKFFPERVFKDTLYEVENYPADIVYGDMSNNTIEEKQRLLEKWAY